jgi:hypothetical protein
LRQSNFKVTRQMKLPFLLVLTLGAALAAPCWGQDAQSPPPALAGMSATPPLAPGDTIPESPVADPPGSRASIADHLVLPPLASVPGSSPQSAQPSGTSSSTAPEPNFDTAGHEVEIFAGSGIGLDGFSRGNPMMNAGARFGWMLTDRKSNRFFSNRFEFAVEVAPLFIAWQPGGAAYGFNFYAFALKWNFTPHGRVAPYFEMAGGAVITNKDIPPGVNSFNFTPTADAGVRILHGKYAWSIGFRWLHISDAGITQLNPGDDTIGVRIGFNRWLR